MKAHGAVRIRRSIQELQDDYQKGKKKPLEDLMRAWKGIKELPADDPRSFFMLGGFHGEPFRGAGWANSTYWGGYCNHGNVLFPTWHRVYLFKLEKALQSIPGCEDVMLPFWDECSDDSVKNGIPWALTQKDFVLDGVTIANPLRSFVFTKGVTDNLSPIPDADYSKPKGYETIRYPLSGLIGTDADRAATALHNAQYPDYGQNVKLLNQNIVNWLGTQVIVNGAPIPTLVKAQYLECLNAPNYTVFSNYTSSTQWNEDLDSAATPVTSLESPHDSIHLAVGGFDLPSQFDVDAIEGANGDMGENDTAAFDPIFYFHHCFVDYAFWVWQKKHKSTSKLEFISEYPGTNSADNQGPTPGVTPNSWLTVHSPLNPFMLTEDGKDRPYTSHDCVNIETQLGYTYSPGSLDAPAAAAERASAVAAPGARLIRVAGINRGAISGSFVIAAFATVNGKKTLVGTKAVLSRWNVQGCANCQSHLEVKAFMPLRGFAADTIKDAAFEVQLRTRKQRANQASPSLLPLADVQKPVFFEIK
jgi:tyrosinase